MKIDVRKKILNLAVASAVGVAGLASLPAHAMNVSQSNLGEVLLFPYYTVKNGFDTVFTVTNTSDRTVVAKIRFREALNSREVRDFNLVLSPFDMWTAAVTVNAAGDGAVVRTYDKSCTSPNLPASTTAVGSTEVPFTNVAFTATPPFSTDKGTTSMSRVQEGYFEIISMGEFAAGAENVAANDVPYSAKHINSVPRNCGYVGSSVLADYDGTNGGVALVAPTDVLKGSVTYINVANGQAVDAPATHIEGFVAAPIWAEPGDVNPDLADGTAAEPANYLYAAVAYADAITTTSADTISTLLMADAVVNEYSSDGVGAMTNWIVTFPTKHHYTDLPAGAVNHPFTQNFPANGTSCDVIGFTMYNREEGSVITAGGNVFSPAPNGPGPATLCYEANVITFNGAAIFGSGTNRLDIDTTAVGTSGWGSLGLVGGGAAGSQGVGGAVAGAATNVPSVGDTGLPVIGFAAVIRNNASAAGNNRNYGSTVMHSYVRN